MVSSSSSWTSSTAAAAAGCCSSAVNVASFVSTKLSRDRNTNRNNYTLWKEQMMCLVESQGLVEFIDGVALPPPKHHADYTAWRRRDRLVKGWILGALGDEALQNVAHLGSARDVWLDLEKTLGKPKPSPVIPRAEEWHKDMPLYQAVLSGDWDVVDVILNQTPDGVEARVDFTRETALHLAVGTGKSESFVSKLVDLMSDDSLAMTDSLGYNPLHTAALMGNLPAAKILVHRHHLLLYASINEAKFPHHLAAEAGHRETLHFLISHTRDDLTINPFSGESGFQLLLLLIDAGFLDMALDLIDKYPHLARMRNPRFGTSALSKIVVNDTIFLDEAQLNFWERIVYSFQPPRWSKMALKLSSTLWEVIIELVPCVKRIHEKKVMREQALRLVKCICKHMEPLCFAEGLLIYKDAMLRAAQVGVHEVVEIIVGAFPLVIYAEDPATKHTFLHLAVRNRCEKVFNLIYQSSNHRYRYLSINDISGNSILHLAATLAPPHKLNLVSGPALQMQRELQWFKETNKFTIPYNKGRPNNAGKTAEMIFTEQHRNLKAEGEKWLKDIAISCMITAALIATVVFAAAITVPGGNESDSGHPILWENSAFTIFAVSDGVSLFTSTTSLLMFLSILTSRYAEEDFLYALPKRLCIGLITLFLSILFMMIAFSSTLYLVFGRKNAGILIPVAALTCLPISSFVLLQFPLLIDVISSTYGKGIFGKQSDRPFH